MTDVQMPRLVMMRNPHELEIEELDETVIPRIRWSPKSNRLEYLAPCGFQPGKNGYLLLHQFHNSHSYGVDSLPKEEQKALENMDKMNHAIEEMEVHQKFKDKVENVSHGKKEEKFHKKKNSKHEVLIDEDVKVQQKLHQRQQKHRNVKTGRRNSSKYASRVVQQPASFH